MQTKLYLTPNDHGRPLTLDEFEHADAQEGYHYELIDGRLQVSPLPDMPHEELRDWLRRVLDRYVGAPRGHQSRQDPSPCFCAGPTRCHRS